MKKSLKLLFSIVFAFIVLSLGKCVQANSISSISMDIYINSNGDASVTEVWNCYTSEGTEVYHPYYNLGNSEIRNLSVSEGNRIYTTLSSWNTSGTLSSKAYKCGINTISNGVELCWGISQYGNHTYYVKYDITGFVSALSDSQMIYWTLIPYDFSTSIGSVYIKIHTSFDIPDTTDVWGYGNYGGTAYVYNGYIEMQSDGRLDTNEYMTILVKFPAGTFSTTNTLNHNFDYYYKMAEKGATKYTPNSANNFTILNVLYGFIAVLLNIFVIFIPFSIIIFAALNTGNEFKFGTSGKKIPNDVPYFRDIPCKNDLFRAYYIGNKYGILKSKTDILGAIILKWLKDSIIKIEQKETGAIFKKENTVVVLNETNPDTIMDSKEKELFQMLYEASKDGILEDKEFEKWCNKSYSKIFSWFDDIITREQKKLVTEGLITFKETVKLKFFKRKIYTATPELKEEALELAGLKRYLNDYTLIKDREAIEVHLFEDYLIYAQLMGIAKKVAKQFKDLYPEIIEQSNFSTYDNILFIHMCASHGVSAATTAKSRAESYSSGGGGFSSGGGGGGSFGGGGGGGGFR